MASSFDTRGRSSIGETPIVTVRHERMHQIDRFRHDFGSDEQDDPGVNRNERVTVA